LLVVRGRGLRGLRAVACAGTGEVGGLGVSLVVRVASGVVVGVSLSGVGARVGVWVGVAFRRNPRGQVTPILRIMGGVGVGGGVGGG
jgi:hypothetical protein